MSRLVAAGALAVLISCGFLGRSAAGTPEPIAVPPITTPLAEAAAKTISDVCLPVLKGGDLTAAARKAGFRLRGGTWTMTLTAGQSIALQPPDVANPHVCEATLIHGIAGGPAIRETLANWARNQTPALAPLEADQARKGPLHDWTVSTWTAQTSLGQESVVLDEENVPAGKPATAVTLQSNLLVSLSPS